MVAPLNQQKLPSRVEGFLSGEVEGGGGGEVVLPYIG